MSRSPIDPSPAPTLHPPVVAPAMHAALRQSDSMGLPGRWAQWGRSALWYAGHRVSRGLFDRSHLLFVQPEQVWHWDAALEAARFAGLERRANRRPVRHDSVAAWCQAHAGSNARLVLSGRLTHQVLVQDGSLPLFEPGDVERYARHQLVHYHGNAAQHWPLAVWLEGSQRGASALHGLDLAALKRDAERFDVRLRGIEPAWAAALRFALREAPGLTHTARAAVALVEGAQLCWLVLERGVLVALRQRMLAAQTLAALEGLIDELRTEDDGAPSVHLLGYGIDADAVQGSVLLGTLHVADHPAPHWLAAA